MPVNNNERSVGSGNGFMARMEFLIREILEHHNVSYYRIESGMDSHTNAPMIKVVTFFDDAVRKIATYIRDEFEVKQDRLAESGNVTKKHIHLALGLTPSRLTMPEYRGAKDLVFDIEITSVLFDVSRSIEKELKINRDGSLDKVQRDLYRVVTLLEMADQEFTKLRSAAHAEADGIVKSGSLADTTEDYYYDNSAAVYGTAPVVSAHYVTPGHQYNTGNSIRIPASVRPTTPPIPAATTPTPQPLATAPEQVVAAEPAKDVKLELPKLSVNEGPHVITVIDETEPKNTHKDSEGPAAQIPNQVANASAEADGKMSLSTFDMSINQPEKLAMNVDSFNGEPTVGDNLTTVISDELMVAEDQGSDESRAVATVDENGKPSGDMGDGVALNIDNIETFNLNVNGMLERRTEVMVDKNAEEDSRPFYERDPKEVKPLVLEENTVLTDAALREYILTSRLVKEVDSEIARRAGATLNAEVDVEGDVERLKYLKVFTLKQLHERIADNKEDIIAFAEKWIGSDNGGSFDSGICLFYLEYLLVGKRNDPALAVEYVLKFISDNDYSARFIIPTYNSISKTDIPIASHLTLK